MTCSSYQPEPEEDRRIKVHFEHTTCRTVYKNYRLGSNYAGLVWMLLAECSESISHNHTTHIKKCPDSIVGKQERLQAFLIYSYIISTALAHGVQYYNLNTPLGPSGAGTTCLRHTARTLPIT